MKKFFTFTILALFPIFILSAVEWNISSDDFKDLGTISETTVISGLTIHAHSEKTIQIDGNNKSLDGMDFTHRLKLGGSGDFDGEGQPLGRVISFDVTGNERITVFCMSSTGSEDRVLNVAFNKNDSILMAMPALGPSLTKSEYVYSGEAGKIFLYSPGSGVNIYYIKVETATEPQPAVEWNISNAEFNALGSIVSTVVIDGLTIYAAEGKSVDIDGNNKTLEEWSFTHRLKLGGSGGFSEEGIPTDRVVAFDVSGNVKITLALQSSSGSTDRVLNVAVNHKETIIASVPALGASISKGVVEYRGGPASIYLYSPSSGVNIYLIKVEPLTVNVPIINITEQNARVFPNPAYDKVFVKIDRPTQIAIYDIAGSMVKSKLLESDSDYINIENLQSGVYIIRSLTGMVFTQKLIVK